MKKFVITIIVLISSVCLTCKLHAQYIDSGESSNVVKNQMDFIVNDDGKSVSVRDIYNRIEGPVSIPSVVNIDGKEYVVSSIDDGAFSYFSHMTSITIPPSVTRIGSRAFEQCTGLTEITIPESVKYMGISVFEGCSNLSVVNLSDNLETIDVRTFYGCSNLRSIRFPASLKTIGLEAFKDCKSLYSIEFPKSLVLVGSDAFEGCSSLTSIFTDKETRPIKKEQINEYYESYDAITSQGIMCRIDSQEQKEMSVCGIMNHDMFQTGIPDWLWLDDDLKYSITAVDNEAFANCKNLEIIYLPGTIAFIGENVFKSCPKLKYICVPLGTKKRFKKMLPKALNDKIVEDGYDISPYTENKIKKLEIMVVHDDVVKEDIPSIDCSPVSTSSLDIEVAVPDKPIKEQNKEDNTIYKSTYQMPQYPGGEAALMKYLVKNIKYPKMASKNGVEGKVVVQFVVKKDGSIGEIKVVRSVDWELDKEAVRVIRKIKKRFNPARNENGEPVNVWYTQPVEFKLNR